MARVAGYLIAASLLLCIVASTASGAAAPGRHLLVSESDYRLQAPGLSTLQAGFVTITVRNNAKGEHGLLVLRLRRPRTRKQIAAALDANNLNNFEALGGIQVVPSGSAWQGTIELEPGRYAIVDGGVNGGKTNYARGMLQIFTVAAGGAGSSPPVAVGRIVMADYSFRISLPKRFNGTGVVEIPNKGKQLHEISLVRTPPGKSAKDVLELAHSRAAPPPGYSLRELLAALDPGNTVYVRFALPRGHYVALCLVQFGTTKKTHADAGMVGEFDVS